MFHKSKFKTPVISTQFNVSSGHHNFFFFCGEGHHNSLQRLKADLLKLIIKCSYCLTGVLFLNPVLDPGAEYAGQDQQEPKGKHRMLKEQTKACACIYLQQDILAYLYH
jgi:hypothetical protein